MSQKKEFDCVEMKNKIQEELYKKRQGLSDKEIDQQIQKNLESSQSVTAKLWRNLQQKSHRQNTSLLQEDLRL